MATAALNGRVLAFVEARMPDEMAGLIRRHGGVPLGAPVLQEHYRTDSPEVRGAIGDVCAGRVDTAIFLTGVGANAMMGIAEAMGRLAEFEDALRNITVVARSPKPGRILRRHKIPITVMPPEPYTSSDLTAAMVGLPLEGKRVVFQRYGGPDSELPTYLREQGADYQELTLYDWGLPDDTGPVVDLIDRMAGGEGGRAGFHQPAAGSQPAGDSRRCGPRRQPPAQPVKRSGRGIRRAGLHPEVGGARHPRGRGTGTPAHGQLGAGRGGLFRWLGQPPARATTRVAPYVSI